MSEIPWICVYFIVQGTDLDQDLLLLKDFFFPILTAPRMNGTADTWEITWTKLCLSTNHPFQLRKCSQRDHEQLQLNSSHPQLFFHPCGTPYLLLLPKGYTSSTPLWAMICLLKPAISYSQAHSAFHFWKDVQDYHKITINFIIGR